MTLTKKLRDAQTQHADASVDIDNIFLYRAMFRTASTENNNNASNFHSEDKEPQNGTPSKNKCQLKRSSSPQCVWFYDLKETAVKPAKEKNEAFTLSLPEKRKTTASHPNHNLKKVKLDSRDCKTKRPGFTEDRYEETSYYIENGLRKVYPYYFTFTTFTKGRWVGEKILDVFSREFRAHPAEEYERCIEAGTLTVNSEKVPIDYRLKHNDLLANIVHRHEVPVSSQPITIVYMDKDILVVNKPPSIPVHPCGRYRHNTVVFILAKEFNMKNLRTIHRLDRLTSGLLLFGKNSERTRQLEQHIRDRLVQKDYVCRVNGKFPDGILECKEPIEVVSYKIGVCKVSPKGKECKTTFRRIHYDGNTSIVHCKPLTGRMHQIRVHLQYLGYPIINDPLYNHEVFGPLKGRGGDFGGKSNEDLINDLIKIHNAENWLGVETDSFEMDNSNKYGNSKETCKNTSNIEQVDDKTNVSVNDIQDSASISSESIKPQIENNDDDKKTVATQTCHETPDFVFDPKKITSDRHCYECKVTYRDPKPENLIMYLHAWKYKGPGWAYETDLPNWAKPNWNSTES